MKAKSLKEKSWEAYEWELSNRHEADGRRKPYGVKPLFHYYFGPYLLWLVTGKWVGSANSVNAEEASKELYQEFGLALLESEAIPFLQQLLAQDKDPLLFNPYRYLLEKLEEENKYLKDDSTRLHRVRHWLTDAMHAADTQARQFHPATYNVATGLENVVKDSAVSEPAKAHSPVQAELSNPEENPQANPSTASSSAVGNGLVALKSMDDILVPNFTLDELDQLAHRVKLVNEAGAYQLGPRKLGAIVGFCQALKYHTKLRGTIPQITSVLGPHFGVVIRTRKASSKVAEHFFRLTDKALSDNKR